MIKSNRELKRQRGRGKFGGREEELLLFFIFLE